MTYFGKRYGHLKMIRPSRKGGKGVGAYWIARCDCGTEKEILARMASRGRILTCGNCIYHDELRRSGKGLTTRRRKEFTAHVARATEEGTKWEISSIELDTYLAGSCSICGDTPKTGKLRIERVDLRKTYTPDNCITCCSECRKMRGSYTIQELIDRITKIYNNLNK